jgi:hypothetical protein
MNYELISYINKYNYQINKIYIDKFWSNINNKDWIYVDEQLIEWIGYKKNSCGKQKFINIIKENFKEGIDYKMYNYEQLNNIFHLSLEINENNKEILAYKDKLKYIHNRTTHIILSPKCFKKSLMLIRTEKANKIRDYYVDIEDLCLEFNKYLLQNKDIELQKNIINDKYKINALLQSLDIKPVVYFGYINEYVIKFGHSNNIQNRIKQHEKTYGSFKIIYIKECHNNKLIESKINQFAKESNVLHNLNIENKNYIELIKLTEDFTIDMIIDKIEYECANLSKNNDELVTKLQNEVKYLQEQIKKLQIEKENLKENKTNLKKESHRDSEFDYITGSQKKYNCTKCNKFSTNKLHDYNDHLNRKYKCDEIREPKKYICHKCNLIFKKPSQLELHLNRKVSCDEVLQCKNCNKIFKILYNYQQHIKKCN